MIRAQLNLGFVLVNLAIIGLIALFWQGNRLIAQAQIESDNILNQLQNVQQPQFEKHADVQTLNSRILALRTIQLEHPPLLLDIQELAKSLSDGIVVVNIQLNYEENLVTISGNAKTRDNLELFQKGIEANNDFTVKEFPFGAFAQSTDIPFTIVLNIKNTSVPL